MNVFILNSGRCGSTTWIQACRHIVNYTSAHESLAHRVGKQRLAYPPRHIEADNRLSWLLGRLDKVYGAQAFYVHLSRLAEATAESFVRRNGFGIMRAYRAGILLNADPALTPRQIADDYLDTVQSNISLFLKDKPHRMQARLENAQQDFQLFWERIGARGDLQSALGEFHIRHNRSE